MYICSYIHTHILTMIEHHCPKVQVRRKPRVSTDGIKFLYLYSRQSIFKKSDLFLFISFMAHWVFVAVQGLSLVAASQGCSSCGKQASHFSGFSCCRAVVAVRRLRSCSSQALQHRLSICGPHGMWDLPPLQIKPKSPALAGRLLTTGPPAKFSFSFLIRP